MKVLYITPLLAFQAMTDLQNHKGYDWKNEEYINAKDTIVSYLIFANAIGEVWVKCHSDLISRCETLKRIYEAVFGADRCYEFFIVKEEMVKGYA